MLCNVVGCVCIQHNTVYEYGDDAGEFERVRNQIADPRAQQDNADLRVEILFVSVLLLALIKLFFHLFLIIFLVIDGGLTF